MRFVYRGLSIILLLFGITMIVDSFNADMTNRFHLQLAILAVAGIVSSALFAIADSVATNSKSGE